MTTSTEAPAEVVSPGGASRPGVHVLGIRHHGPGSARAVVRALEEIQPDTVLIEGPVELEAVVPLVASAEMAPPVAGLVYAVDEPRRASFYPMAVFSPEWVAMKWALANDRPIRMIDLPAKHALALTTESQDPPAEDDADGDEEGHVATDDRRRTDPIGLLAEAAGYDDPERWWEDALELRHHGSDLFALVTEAMATVREAEPNEDEHTEIREACMRKNVRAAMKEHDSIAVVCGAFHAPVLQPETFPSVKADNARLKGLPKIKVAATWAPWTAERLSFSSGYGAGVASPGWYEHLFVADPESVIESWLTKLARELRRENLTASSAGVIEATRLATATAALRGRPLPGLAEVTEAAQAVLCGGSSVPLQVIWPRLVVGDALGRVPDETPMVPLAKDITKRQKSLRLKVTAEEKTVELDLRRDGGRERSKLFHRLNLLGIGWALGEASGRTGGTFKEVWRLEWKPEFSVAIIEASRFGTTVQSAASTALAERAAATSSVKELAALAELALLSELPEGLAAAVHRLDVCSAQSHDVAELMEAVMPLARMVRYGNVREVDTSAAFGVLQAVIRRSAVGLRPACLSLDEEAAIVMRAAVESVSDAIGLVGDSELHELWFDALGQLAVSDSVNGLVLGRANRILLDAGAVDVDEVSVRMHRALSTAADAVDGAGWIDGFVKGDIALLLHDDRLIGLIDGWVTDIGDDTFNDVLPLLRRSFSRFEKPERRQLGTLLSQPASKRRERVQHELNVNAEHALAAQELVFTLLGIEPTEGQVES